MKICGNGWTHRRRQKEDRVPCQHLHARLGFQEQLVIGNLKNEDLSERLGILGNSLEQEMKRTPIYRQLYSFYCF